MKYKNSNGVSVDFLPWFDPEEGQHRFTSLHIYEELGGTLAHGSMEMMMNGSDVALNLIETERTGTLTIEKEDSFLYEIPVIITNLEQVRNLVSIEFVCSKTQDFFTRLQQITWDKKDITSVIQSLYPGKQDIRCETDIQDGELTFYQNRETDMDLLERLCYSFKKDSVFTFGWEGLMIKETMGKCDSQGNTEPYLVLKMGDGISQLSPDTNHKLKPDIYYMPYNVWEDTEQKVALEDYTEKEPIYLRQIKRYGATSTIQTKYLQLEENSRYNRFYMGSEFFKSLVITNFMTMPNYKIGDVLTCEYLNKKASDIDWPYKYYLVKSNELFMAIEGSDVVDSNGQVFSWTSKLLALEDNGSIAIGSEEDPYNNEE